jgi:hypothetical protein
MVVAVVMLVTAAVVGTGAALEFAYFGPESTQFWVGVFTVPASVFFAVAALAFWRSLRAARTLVVIAAVLMLAATSAATRLDVMGPPATLLAVIGSLVALEFGWRRSIHST